MGSTVRVIFRPHPEFQEADDTINVPLNVPINLQLNERQLWFLEELAQGKHLRSPALVTRWNITKKTAKRDLAFLQEHGLIHFVGGSRTGTYELLSDRSDIK